MDQAGDNTVARGRNRTGPLQQHWAGADSDPRGRAAFIRPERRTRFSAAGAGCVCDGLSPQAPSEPGPGKDAPALGGLVSDSECGLRSPAPAALAIQRELGEKARPLVAQRLEGAGPLPIVSGCLYRVARGLKLHRRSKREHPAVSEAAQDGGSHESPQARHGVAVAWSAPLSDTVLGPHGSVGLPFRTAQKAEEAGSLALNAAPLARKAADRPRPGIGLPQGPSRCSSARSSARDAMSSAAACPRCR